MQKHNKNRVSGRTTRAAIAAIVSLTFAPLAASANAPDTGTVAIDAAASAAVIEVMPAAPAPAIATPPVSAPVIEEKATVLGRGSASFYAQKFDGRRTASGEAFSNRALTGAHRTLPFGTRVRVTNPANGASVVVRINDRGPFTAGRMIDVSRAAAERLGMIARGHATVELARID